MSRPPSTYPFDRDMRSGIYVIRNMNGTVYVGSAVCLFHRWKRHLNELKKGIHTNQHLLRSWNFHGSDQFTWEVIEVVPPELLLSREQHWLNFYRSQGPVYNTCLTAGSSLGVRRSEETKKRMSDAAKRRGDTIVRDEEWRQKVSAANKENVRTRCDTNMREKMRLAKRGNQHAKGLVWAHDTKANYRVRPNDPRLQTGELCPGRRRSVD